VLPDSEHIVLNWLRNLFKRELVVHNHIDQTPAYMMEQWNGSLYVMTRGGKLYRLYHDVSDQIVCQHVLTLNSY
jgi:hypothetical protein